jgi:hypothetical protein
MVYVLYTVNTLNLSYITPLFTIAFRQWITNTLVSISRVITVSKCSVCMSLTTMYCKRPLPVVNYSEGGFFRPILQTSHCYNEIYVLIFPPVYPSTNAATLFVLCRPLRSADLYFSIYYFLFVDLPRFRQLQFAQSIMQSVSQQRRLPLRTDRRQAM